MSKTFDTAVLHIRRLLDGAGIVGVPREHLAYYVPQAEYDMLRTEMVAVSEFVRGPTTYTPTGIRILGVPVVPHE